MMALTYGTRTGSDRLALAAARLTWAAFACSTIVATVAFSDATGGPLVRADGDAWVSFGVDRLTVVLLMLVTGVSATVQSYARRYLRGEATQARFVGLTVALTVGCVALVSAGTLVTVAIAWTVTGVTIVAVADLHPTRTSLASDRRRIRTAFALGDGSLILATLILSSLVGTIPLQDADVFLRRIDAAGEWAFVAAALVVVAASARCALFPFSSWLPATLGAPTPVSALLHAGAVNGGGLLLIRLAPVLDAWASSWYLAAGIGAVTALWAAAVMSVTVDVKGSLVRSTSAQMGFMIVTVAAGLPAAAVAHLVAHGLYKAALFLGSGSAVHDITAYRALPPPRQRSAGWPLDIVAVTATGVSLFATVALLDRTGIALELDAAKVALLCFAWATASIALRGWLGRAHNGTTVAVAAGSVMISTSLYVVGVAAFTYALAPTLPSSTNGPGALAFAPLVGGLLVLLVGRAWIPVTSRLHRRAYVVLLAQTHAVRSSASSGRSARRPGPKPLMSTRPLDLDPVGSPLPPPSVALSGSETSS